MTTLPPRASVADEHTPLVTLSSRDDFAFDFIMRLRAEGYRGPIAIEQMTDAGQRVLVGILRGLDE